MLINTAIDLQVTEASPEQQAFLTALLNDYVTFDDAVYPEGYDRTLQSGNNGYVPPALRQEWNAGAAAGWGFTNREQIETALANTTEVTSTVLIRARSADGTFIADDPATPEDESWVTP